MAKIYVSSPFRHAVFMCVCVCGLTLFNNNIVYMETSESIDPFDI